MTMQTFTHVADQHLYSAIALLGDLTANRYDVWLLAGPFHAADRAAVMGRLLGRKMPQSKSGVNAIRAEFYRRANITGDCEAAREYAFATYCRAAYGGRPLVA